MFFWNSCFFDDPTNVGNLVSGSSAFSESSLNIWKFTVLILSKPGLENFEHFFASMWDECICAVVWTFYGIAFLWNENTFSSPVATAEFSKFAGILSAALLTAIITTILGLSHNHNSSRLIPSQLVSLPLMSILTYTFATSFTLLS